MLLSYSQYPGGGTIYHLSAARVNSLLHHWSFCTHHFLADVPPLRHQRHQLLFPLRSGWWRYSGQSSFYSSTVTLGTLRTYVCTLYTHTNVIRRYALPLHTETITQKDVHTYIYTYIQGVWKNGTQEMLNKICICCRSAPTSIRHAYKSMRSLRRHFQTNRFTELVVRYL